MNFIIDLLSSSGYVTYNKAVARRLGISEAVLLGELCSKYKYWYDRGELVKNEGWFFMNQLDIQHETGLSPHQQRTAIVRLIDHGIVKCVKKGQPARNWYSIDPECLHNWMLKNSTTSGQETSPLEVKEFYDINRSTKKETKKENKVPPTPYEKIKDEYNRVCTSFPRLTVLSEARRKAINARIRSGYTVEDFERLFATAECSDFLKGKNNRNWSANFDWLIKDANMAKVLDGNYSNNTEPEGGSGNDGWSF